MQRWRKIPKNISHSQTPAASREKDPHFAHHSVHENADHNKAIISKSKDNQYKKTKRRVSNSLPHRAAQTPLDLILQTLRLKGPQNVCEYYQEITLYLLKSENSQKPTIQFGVDNLENISILSEGDSKEWITVRVEIVDILMQMFSSLGIFKSLYMSLYLIDYGVLRLVQDKMRCQIFKKSSTRLKKVPNTQVSTLLKNQKNEEPSWRKLYEITHRQVEKIMISSMLTACKYHEYFPPYLKELNSIIGSNVLTLESEEFEKQTLDTLGFKLQKTSEETFLSQFLLLLNLPQKIYLICHQILMKGLFNLELWFEKPSVKACAAIMLALSEDKDDLQFPVVILNLTSHQLPEIKRVALLYQRANLIVTAYDKMPIIKDYVSALFSKGQ